MIDAFTKYADLVRAIRNSVSHPSWSEEKLSCSQKQMNRFKSSALTVFEQYQASNMKTFKRHALNHVVHALRQVESIEYLDAGIFKSAQKLFKEKYRK